MNCYKVQSTNKKHEYKVTKCKILYTVTFLAASLQYKGTFAEQMEKLKV